MSLKVRFIPSVFLNQIFLCLMVLLCFFTPFYQFQRMFLILSVFIGWFCTTIAIDPLFLNRSMKTVVLMVLIVVMYLFTGVATGASTETILLGVNKMPTFVWILMFQFYSYHPEYLEKMYGIFFIIIFINAFLTLRGNIIYPGSSRLLAGTTEYYRTQRELYRSQFIGGYDIIYGLTFLVFPLLIYFKKIKTYGRIFLLIIITSCLVCILVSGYTFAIIFSLCFIFISIAKKPNILKTVLIIFVALLLTFILREIILQFFIWVGNSLNLEIMVKRFSEILSGTYIEAEGNKNRLHLYLNAIKNWLDHPIFGNLLSKTSEYRRSGHSAIFSYLEDCGCLSIVYFILYRIMYKSTMYVLKSKLVIDCYKLSYILFIVFLFVNTFDVFPGIGFCIFFLVPTLFIRIDKSIINNEANALESVQYGS